MTDLNGRAALVTGAAGGIGGAVVAAPPDMADGTLVLASGAARSMCASPVEVDGGKAVG